MENLERVLEGKRVLIVGGGGNGIGRSITRGVAKAAGTVAIVDIEPTRAEEAAEEIVDLGGTAVGLSGDVRQAGDVERLVTETVEALGGIDVLITVVGGHGIFVPYQSLELMSDEQWDLILDLNIKYVFRFVRAIVKVFSAQGSGGTIVSIGSVAGVRGAPNSAPYGVAKAGLINLAKTISVEYGRRGVRMNVITCGLILTPAARISMSPDMETRIPLGRAGSPDEVANMAVFLASPLSSYLSGQNIILDGAVTQRAPLRLPVRALPGQQSRQPMWKIYSCSFHRLSRSQRVSPVFQAHQALYHAMAAQQMSSPLFSGESWKRC